MRRVTRCVSRLIGASISIGLTGGPPALSQTPSTLPAESGFYYAGHGKYFRLPASIGEE